MKKNYYSRVLSVFSLAALMFFVSNQANAQSDNPGPNIGIKGGLNLSQFYVDQPNVEDENMKVGYHFGLFTKIPITDFLAVQPELLYSNTGSKIAYGGSDLENLFGIEPGEVRFNLNYIQVPVALAVNVGPLNIHGGPYVAYLVSANVTDLSTSNLNSTTLEELNTEDFNRIDYGVLVGVAVDLRGVTIGARYNYGLREIGSSGLAGNLTSNSKNSVGQLYVGFGF